MPAKTTRDNFQTNLAIGPCFIQLHLSQTILPAFWLGASLFTQGLQGLSTTLVKMGRREWLRV